MATSYLTSQRVTAFLPVNTWTEVILPSSSDENGVYMVTTEDRMKKRLEDMNKISLNSSFFEKVQEFKPLKIVAVKIDDNWFRGKLISYNEFRSDDTKIEVIDVGYYYQTKLQNLLALPYYFEYDPLVLPIKFKNFTLEKNTTKITIKPLLAESDLFEGFVFVDVIFNDMKMNHIQNEKQLVDNIIESPSTYRKEYNNVLPRNGDFCVITHFKNFTEIYVRKFDDDSVNNCISVLEKTAKSTDKITKNHIVVGDLVKVYTPLNCFSRAKILKNNHNGYFNVFFIDIGSTETVQSDVIFELTEELKKPIATVVKIGISGIKYTPMCNEVQKMIQSFIDKHQIFRIEYEEDNPKKYQEVTLRRKDNGENIFIQKNNIITVAIDNDNNTILNESPTKDLKNISLKNKDHCKIKQIHDFGNSNNKNGLKNVQAKEVKPNHFINEVNLTSPPVEKVLKNKDSCFITHFENLDTIYVSKHKEFLQNMDIVKKTIENTVNINKQNPVKGEIVKVYSHLFEDYYRAKIINIENNDKFQVFHIDFGSTEFVCLSDIFELTDNCDLKPGIAIKIGIKVECSTNRNKEIMNFFKSLIKSFILVSVEFNESSNKGLENSVLKVISTGLNINDEVLKILNQPVAPPKLENKQSLSIGVSKVTSEPLKNGEPVYLRYFQNFTSIFVSKGSDEDKNKFFYVFEKTNEDDSPKKVKIEVGDIVKAMYENVKSRAKILKKINEKQYYVSFLDFGNEEVVSVDHIFELPDDLKEIPSLCIKIGIKGCSKIEVTDFVKDYFTELESILYIEYDENNPKGLQEVNLRTKNNSNILDELLEIIKEKSEIKDAVEKSTEVKISNVELNSGDTVFCTHFEDFDHLYLSKGNQDNDTPENYYTIKNYLEKEDNVVKKKPACGELVSVKIESTKFRAKILKNFEDLYAVFLLDLGSIKNVHINDIFELSNDLKSVPGLAKKVGLKVVKTLNKNKVEFCFSCLWNNEQKIPLILMYDENNSNNLNKVTLKKKSDGQDVIDDIISKEINLLAAEKEIKPALQSPKNDDFNRKKNVKSGDIFEFLSAKDVNNFYMKHVKWVEEFKSTFEQLQMEKRENLKPIRSTPLSDVIFLAYSTKCMKLCRAKIVETINRSEFKCIFIDLGFYEQISLTDIYELPKYLALHKIPRLVHRFGLAGLTCINNNPKFKLFLESLIGKHFIVEYDSSLKFWYKQVKIKHPQSKMSLNDEIKNLFSNQSTTLDQKQRLEKKIITTPELIENEKPKLSFPIKSGSLVQITHFEDFNKIFIRDTAFDYIEEFNKLNLKMLKYYRNDSNCIRKTVHVGDIVCVSTIVNSITLCRAKIENIIDDQCDVFYFDFGVKERVKLDDIFELPETLKILSNFAVEVQLQKKPLLISKNMKKIVDDYFHKLIINTSNFILEFNEYDPKGLNNVILITELDKKNIVDKIETLLNIEY